MEDFRPGRASLSNRPAYPHYSEERSILKINMN